MMVVVECIYLPKGLWSWKHEPESVAEGEGRGGVEEGGWVVPVNVTPRPYTVTCGPGTDTENPVRETCSFGAYVNTLAPAPPLSPSLTLPFLCLSLTCSEPSQLRKKGRKRRRTMNVNTFLSADPAPEMRGRRVAGDTAG